ncbi:carbohydrate sulfotransferase 11-like [Ruditapes philippinarum]|uniref:carbohydrate sulfotransferase 11-like n=1 Tax=Ruditapes philippinarum TaxID=129788 RepID=UPI00295BB76D|nr:carbohydrate sulfotransferase 11-like [Ruditapes philippinarum]
MFQEQTRPVESSNRKHKLKIAKACEDQGTPQATELEQMKIPDFIWVEKKHSLLYCAIPKVASTFWRRTVTIMGSNENVNSPFESKKTDLRNFGNLKRDINEKSVDDFLKNASSFLFVRDPYGRLFSGYEHKLYNPNLSFWKNYGMRIAKTVRQNPSNESLRYGHDITFAEFVKYILFQKDNHYRINRHFTPMYQKCDPCRVPYDYIGHLETFRQDAEYLFGLWRRKFTDFHIHFNDFEKETVLDTAGSLINRLFNSYNKLKPDFKYPFYNLVLRVWSDLQIRGYLSKDIPLPFTKGDVDTLTAENMLKAVSDALETKVNLTAVKLQRRESLQQAYSTVPLEDMERLHEYVLKDCQLFGYNDRPKLLYERGQLLESNHLYLAGL